MNTPIKTITPADLADPTAPADGWYIIEAPGTWHHADPTGEGNDIIQIIDETSLAAIVAAGIPEEGLLVDRDHLSHDNTQPTAALAWVRALALVPHPANPTQHALAARLEYTSEGLPLIQGKIYRHFSTEYNLAEAQDLGDNTYRPTRLVGLALTNRPNNGGQPPITNRKTNPFATETPIAKNQTQTTNQKKTKHMQEEQMRALALKLGLTEDATFEDISAAVDELFASVQNAEEASAKEIVENADEEDELNDEEKDMYAGQIVANRERGLRLLSARLQKNRTRQRAATADILNRRPRPVLLNREDRARQIAIRAREMQRAGEHGGNWTRCYNAARAEINA